MQEQLQILRPLDNLIIDSVDETLSMLGQQVQMLFYIHLAINVKMTKEEIPNKLNDFMAEIEKTMGKGAKQIELHLIKTIEKKTKLSCTTPVEDRQLERYIYAVRQKLQNTQTLRAV